MKYLALPLLMVLVGVTPADEKKPPAPKLPLGKDTTYVTGPLDKYGYIDYEAALNAELSKGITRDNNANALIILALGPAPEGGDGLPVEYFKWLDVPVPPKDGDYFISSGAYITGKLGISGERLEAVYEFQARANKRPWTPKDCPPLAEWISANEKPIALVAEAVKRSEYFNPITSRRKPGESSNLLGGLLPSVQKCRELAAIFTARAMLRLQDKKYDDAWADLLACHRLGRLVGRGGTLIESLVGIAIGQVASNATATYIERADLSSKQYLACLNDLQKLPATMTVAHKIDICERMMGLDALQMVRRGGGNVDLKSLIGEPDGTTLLPDEKKALETLDWTTTMQTMNKWYDRMVAAMRLKDRAARTKEFDKMLDQFNAVKKEFGDEEKVKKLLKDKDAGKVIGKALGNVLMGLLSPATQKVQYAEDRSTQVFANLEVAFALAAYRKDNGRYPAKLSDIAPKYLASVPADLFSGKPLVYKPNDKGYLLYSVGLNEKDDGGELLTDMPPGDDLGVRMPQPELKK